MGLTPVILSGGAGARLWPVSRQTHPKPFITMPDGQSLLQKALLNGLSLIRENTPVLVVTSRDLFFKLHDQLAGLPPVDCRAILEPVGRNTAPAIVAATLECIRLNGPEQVLMILAADHLINGPFGRQVLQQALPLAEKGRIVTFGIKPDRPETGYGYIETRGEKVVRFVEKPDTRTAGQYLAAGNFFWNSGMFCFRADVMLRELELLCPDLLQSVRASLAVSQHKHWLGMDTTSLDEDTFSQVQDISIDYAVMEKTDKLVCLPADFSWSDIGSWEALCQQLPSGRDGNQTQGEVVLHNVRNSFIKSHNRLVAALGVENLLIIDTPDALLVADKSSSQEVKKIYSQLKQQEHPAHQLHRQVARPWGTYTVLEEGPGYKIKRVEVKPGASLSLQRHSQRSEHWVVVAGQALVNKVDEQFMLQANQSTYIAVSEKHRLANPGGEPLIIIEVQSGKYLGEDDIERFDDQYQRHALDHNGLSLI